MLPIQLIHRLDIPLLRSCGNKTPVGFYKHSAPAELVRRLLPLLAVPSLPRRLRSFQESFIQPSVSCSAYFDQIKLASSNVAQTFGEFVIAAHGIDLIQSFQICVGSKLPDQSANAILFDELIEIA